MDSAVINQPATSVADGYRYKRFTTNLLFRDLRFRKDAAAPGDAFPQFELLTTEGSILVNENVFGDKPVIFIFGSMTCPMTASAAPSVQVLYDEFSDRVEFIMLYVREAHPGEYFGQSETIEEKLDYAQTLKDFYDIRWTVVWCSLTVFSLRKFSVRHEGFNSFDAKILKQSYKAGQVAVAGIDGGQRYGRKSPLGHDFHQAAIL